MGVLAAYKSKTDPVHIFWDLDATLLCSITPIPTKNNFNDKNILSHFEQIDDDFPFEPNAPNTRTYFRPGCYWALQMCSSFGVLHVYTAAQASYTDNILAELDPDRTLFAKVIHRDMHPEIVKKGKDLNIGTDDLRRAILFDDRVSNFLPQRYANGVAVMPFTADRVAKLCHGESWSAYLEEVREMTRLVGIAFLSHLSGDVRNVVGWVRSWKNPMQ